MKVKSLLFTTAAAIASTASAQDQYPDYQDYADGYEQDNLYENYAMKQQEKGGGGGWVRIPNCSKIMSIVASLDFMFQISLATFTSSTQMIKIGFPLHYLTFAEMELSRLGYHLDCPISSGQKFIPAVLRRKWKLSIWKTKKLSTLNITMMFINWRSRKQISKRLLNNFRRHCSRKPCIFWSKLMGFWLADNSVGDK